MMGNYNRWLLFIAVYFLLERIQANEKPLWRWTCNSGSCLRQSTITNPNNNNTFYSTIEICRLICGDHGALWPRPTYSKINQNLIKFAANSIKFEIVTQQKDLYINDFISKNIELTTNLLKKNRTSADICPKSSHSVTIYLSVVSGTTALNWNTSETYNLTLTTENDKTLIKISGETIFGARHGLETLSQLIEFDPNDGCLVMSRQVKVRDSPKFPHRGLLLDVARNFQSIDVIKRHIVGMAASKMNVLHLHLTDSQSFPLQVPALPNMTKFGTFSAEMIYHPEDIEDLLSFARFRGIRILMEIDAPAHAGNGWQWGPEAGLGDLAVCVNENPWRPTCIQPPCGQLNPVNPNVYKILRDLFSYLIKVLPKGEIFHMGGDEVFYACWNSTPEIVEFIGKKPRSVDTFLDLWSQFQDKVLEEFDNVTGDADTPIVLWTSDLTKIDVIEKYLTKERYVIQTWVPAIDTLPAELIQKGYRIILSTKDAWYLDHGFWGTTIYHNWRVVYDNKIPNSINTLGGEVCMWGELVDTSSVETRVWPRAAAAAERLWSDPGSNANIAASRFYRHRERLVSRGLSAEALIPRWCYQNEGQC